MKYTTENKYRETETKPKPKKGAKNGKIKSGGDKERKQP